MKTLDRTHSNALNAAWSAEVPKGLRVLLADAQTSGGLLFAVAAPDDLLKPAILILVEEGGWDDRDIVAVQQGSLVPLLFLTFLAERSQSLFG